MVTPEQPPLVSIPCLSFPVHPGDRTGERAVGCHTQQLGRDVFYRIFGYLFAGPGRRDGSGVNPRPRRGLLRAWGCLSCGKRINQRTGNVGMGSSGAPLGARRDSGGDTRGDSPQHRGGRNVSGVRTGTGQPRGQGAADGHTQPPSTPWRGCGCGGGTGVVSCTGGTGSCGFALVALGPAFCIGDTGSRDFPLVALGPASCIGALEAVILHWWHWEL